MKTNLFWSLVVIWGPMLSLSSVQEQKAAFPAWKAPPIRENAKTIFAPQPREGNNIFKGEASQWLRNAVLEVEVGGVAVGEDKEIAAYIQKLGDHLAAHSSTKGAQYEFIVTNDTEANAFNIGGGNIYIHLGLLKLVENEDELACVLAHEIGHDEFQHLGKTITRQMYWMIGVKKVSSQKETVEALQKLLARYEANVAAALAEAVSGIKRADEIEADKAAFYTAYRAGYNPMALNAVLKRLASIYKQEVKAAGENYTTNQLLQLLPGTHPVSAQRTTAISWESNFVKMPGKEERWPSAAFAEMKRRLNKY